jgi:hypothetical protein
MSEGMVHELVVHFSALLPRRKRDPLVADVPVFASDIGFADAEFDLEPDLSVRVRIHGADGQLLSDIATTAQRVAALESGIGGQR